MVGKIKSINSFAPNIAAAIFTYPTPISLKKTKSKGVEAAPPLMANKLAK